MYVRRAHRDARNPCGIAGFSCITFSRKVICDAEYHKKILSMPILSLTPNHIMVVTMDVTRYVIEAIFDGEMAGIEAVHFCLRQICKIGLSSLGSEKDIPLSPENNSVRLAFLQKSLPLRIEVDICAVIVKEVKLYSASIWTLHGGVEVRIPIVGTDQLGQF